MTPRWWQWRLPGGEVAIVDEADRGIVESGVWWALHTNSRTNYVYGYLNGRRREQVLLHRLLLNAPTGQGIDHQNRNGLDNRRSNLRLATQPQNNANTGPRSTNRSGYKGVFWDKQAKRWRAQIRVNGKRTHLGRFSDPWEAAEAYNRAALGQWGEFAWLNEP